MGRSENSDDADTQSLFAVIRLTLTGNRWECVLWANELSMVARTPLSTAWNGSLTRFRGHEDCLTFKSFDHSSSDSSNRGHLNHLKIQ
jgi:hypothetical protein